MALLNTKQKLALSTKGHKLLKQKRDALILEFFDVVKQAKDLRTQADEACITAFKSLALSQAFHGKAFLENAARSAENRRRTCAASDPIVGSSIRKVGRPSRRWPEPTSSRAASAAASSGTTRLFPQTHLNLIDTVTLSRPSRPVLWSSPTSGPMGLPGSACVSTRFPS